jgi:carbamoyl-phosphate synthase large subunit
LVAKPRHGSGSRGIRLLERPEDLRGLPRDGSYLLQEPLPGEEFSVDVLAYVDGRVAAAVPRSRLKVDSGIAVAGRTVDDAQLIAQATDVARVVGLSTVANVQFRRDVSGVPKILEVNARFPGTMPLTVASGVDMPVLALEDLLGRPVPEHVAFRPLAMVRHWSEVFLDVEDLAALGRPAALGLPTGD